MSEKNQLDPKEACRLLIGLSPGSVDEKLIRDVLGNVVLGSMSEVAQAFGVSAATVRHTWRRDGMPGEAKKGTSKSNKFPLADILIWFLKRAGANAKSRGVDEYTERLRKAEVEAAEARLRHELRKEQQQTGKQCDVAQVRSEMASIFGVVRDGLLELPRHMKPMFPATVAEEAAAEMDRLIRLELTRMSEMNPEDFVKGVDEDGQGQEPSEE